MRAEWVDACRGLGMLLVVLGHCSTPFNKLIYGFHMSLFFILTGYLKKKDTDKNEIQKYALRYIAPYFLLCATNLILFCVTQVVKGNEWPDITHYAMGILYSRGTLKWMPNCSPLWYLTALFVAMTLLSKIERINYKRARLLITLACPLVSYCLYIFNVVKLPWNIDTALMAMIFIAVGENIRTIEGKTVKVEIIVAMAITGLLAIYFNPIDEVSFDNNKYGNLVLMLIGATFVSLSMLAFCKKICSKVKIRYLSFLGETHNAYYGV